MTNILVMIITIALTFVLQCTFFQIIAIGTIVPNALVVLCVSMGIMRGRKFGIFLGFFTGLLVDVFFGPMLGFHALIYMYVGYLSGFAFQTCYDDDLKVPLLFTAVCDLLYNLAFYALRFLLRGRLDLGVYFKRIMIPEMLYTVVITFVLYKVYYAINYRFMKSDRKERKSVWVVK